MPFNFKSDNPRKASQELVAGLDQMRDFDDDEVMVDEVTVAEPAQEKSVMWIEKYRPKSLADLISHTEIISTLQKLIAKNQLPHLLFTGPPGTGKTSTILACARKMYGNTFKSMVLELNASDDRGIDVVREKIKGFVSTKQLFSKDNSGNIKLVILDEADAMSSSAQMALRRVLEKYVSNARFCIICNYVNKIIPALQSRCTKFRFGPLPPDSARERLSDIAKQERISLDADALNHLLLLSNGDMRRSINVMQSAYMSIKHVSAKLTADDFYRTAGAPHPDEIGNFWNVLTRGNFNEALALMNDLSLEGVAVSDLVNAVLPFVVKSKEHQANAKTFLYAQLADIEHRLCVGGSEEMNKAAFVGAFALAKAITGDTVIKTR